MNTLDRVAHDIAMHARLRAPALEASSRPWDLDATTDDTSRPRRPARLAIRRRRARLALSTR